MAAIPRDKREQRIVSLVDMGVTRAAAKAALRAKSWQVDEAALIVFDDRYSKAVDIPTSDEEDVGTPATSPDKGKGKAREIVKLPTPDEDADGLEDEMDDEDNDVYDEGQDDDFDEDDNVGEDFADSDEGSVTYGDGDAYAFLDVSKDRQVEIKEVEEPVKRVVVSKTKRGEVASLSKESGQMSAEIFGLQRWLSGCPEGSEQQQLFPLYNSLVKSDFMSTPCPYKCGGIIEHDESDFFAVPESFPDYIDRLCRICQVACPKCKKSVCLACNEPCELPKTLDAPKDYTRAPNVLLHCANLQAVIIGVGLHMAGRLWDENSSTESTSTSGARKRKVSGAVGADAEDYVETRMAQRSYFLAGTGYGGGKDDDTGVKAAAKVQQAKDKQLAKLLAYVRVYLPNRDRPGPFQNTDHMPASQTLAHLRRRFNPIASMLLSAESLSDMSERKQLYTEFMAWLEVMSGHENLAGLMGQPIMRVSSITYADAVPTSKSIGRKKIIVFHSSPGPRELLERILSQVQVAKKVALASKAREDALRKEREDRMTEQEKAEAAMHEANTPTALENEASGNLYGSEETGRLMEFCDTIEKAVASIDKALRQSKRGEAVLKSMKSHSVLSTSPTGRGPSSVSIPAGNSNSEEKSKTSSLANMTDEGIEIMYTQWAKEMNYGYHDWRTPAKEGETLAPSLAYKHAYSTDAVCLTSSNARNTVLMKEHASLSSSLPAGWNSSVFLLTDEGRPDIIKALVIGPDDTPYENGCFIFDILLGGTYNQSPPSVKIMTTKNGKYRLNPNLYAEGKVCLSLLGTWSGPGWVAGKSTLLQVLISIQSMILWSEPITNEPGFERENKSPKSKAYNANVRRMVVHISMLEYLKTPPSGFEDIIKTHFKLKARSLKKQLDKWLAEDDGKPLYGDSMSSATSGSYLVGSSASAAAAVANPGQTMTAFAKDIEEVKTLLDKLVMED